MSSYRIVPGIYPYYRIERCHFDGQSEAWIRMGSQILIGEKTYTNQFTDVDEAKTIIRKLVKQEQKQSFWNKQEPVYI